MMNAQLSGDFTHIIQANSGMQIWQEAFLNKVEQKGLVLDTIDSVQKQHHGCFVIWTEAPGHIRLHDTTIWNEPNSVSVHVDLNELNLFLVYITMVTQSICNYLILSLTV